MYTNDIINSKPALHWVTLTIMFAGFVAVVLA
jgi:hypothetical protein